MRFRAVLLATLALLLVTPLLSTTASGGPIASAWRALGVETFEPTLGVDAEGRIFYSTTPVGGVAIGFGTGVHRSTDGGLSWTDVSPKIANIRMPPETNDPYVYVDETTGRVFQFAMAPVLVCSIMSWSDDQGASWTTNPRGCAGGVPWDHQTMVASKPRTLVTTPLYPNVLTMCTNQGVDIMCGRSLDGGLSWLPAGVVPSVAGCSLHGHLKAAPDGTIYLPRTGCSNAVVFVSKNDGVSWQSHVISTPLIPPIGGPDSTVAVDDDGNAYSAYIDMKGGVRLSKSTNGGATWSAPILVSPPGVTANLPALAAGSAGRVVVAYVGTTGLANGYQSSATSATTWDAYLTVSTNALDAAPTFDSVIANPPGNPIVRGSCGPGRCPGQVDFIDVTITPAGAPFAAFVDACTGACVTGAGGNNASQAFVATLASGPSLR